VGWNSKHSKGGGKYCPFAFQQSLIYSRSKFDLTFRKPTSTAENHLMCEANLQDSLAWDPSQKGKVEEKTCLGPGEIENPGENNKKLEKTS